MHPIDVLRREHELIRSALGVLDAASRRIAMGEPARQSLETLIEFFDRFADGCHHAKEEEMFFPALTAAGVPPEDGPLAMMAGEHCEGRRLLAMLRVAVDDLGDEKGRRYFRQLADSYVGLLAHHIEKEEQLLFPMAAELLDNVRRLSAEFDDFEEERAPGARERWEQIVGAIARDAQRG